MTWPQTYILLQVVRQLEVTLDFYLPETFVETWCCYTVITELELFLQLLVQQIRVFINFNFSYVY